MFVGRPVAFNFPLRLLPLRHTRNFTTARSWKPHRFTFDGFGSPDFRQLRLLHGPQFALSSLDQELAMLALSSQMHRSARGVAATVNVGSIGRMPPRKVMMVLLVDRAAEFFISRVQLGEGQIIAPQFQSTRHQLTHRPVSILGQVDSVERDFSIRNVRGPVEQGSEKIEKACSVFLCHRLGGLGVKLDPSVLFRTS